MPDYVVILTKDIVPRADADSLPEASNDAPLLENARRERCCRRKQYLDSNESNNQYSHKSQQCYDTPIAPLETVNAPESQNDGASDSQHTSGHPTEVPTEDRPHQVPGVQCQGCQVATASSSRGAWLYLGQGP